MVIFQNYFNPYRHKLFAEIAKTLSLTVVYMQKPQEEGRKWTEEQFVGKKNYQTLQLSNKRLSRIKPFNQIVWVTGLQQVKNVVKKGTKVVFLDNMPTNFTMLRVIAKLGHIPHKDRILWNEHILPNDGDSWVKNLYRKFMTILLAINVSTVLSFSAMNKEYLDKLGIPLTGQKVARTIQAVYTEEDIKELEKQRIKATESPKNNQSSLTFGFLGYMSTRKGIREMLTATKYYKNDQARFLFVGAGPLKEEIARAAEHDPRIELLPYAVTEAQKTSAFNKMTVHLVPSEKDPWCLVVNEAATRGVPSLVSPNVGAKELMQKVDSRFILDDNRAITLAKIFTEIEDLSRNKAEWWRLQDKTREVARSWTIELAASAFVKLAKISS